MFNEQNDNHGVKDMIMPLSLSGMLFMQAMESFTVLKMLDVKMEILTELVSNADVCKKDNK